LHQVTARTFTRRSAKAVLLCGLIALLSACSSRLSYLSGTHIDQLLQPPVTAADLDPGNPNAPPPARRLERDFVEYRLGMYSSFADGGSRIISGKGEPVRFGSDLAGRIPTDNIFERGYDDARGVDLAGESDPPARRANPAEQLSSSGEAFFRFIRLPGESEGEALMWGFSAKHFYAPSMLPPWTRVGVDWGMVVGEESGSTSDTDLSYWEWPVMARVDLFPEQAFGAGLSAGVGFSPLSMLADESKEDHAAMNYMVRGTWSWGWKLFALGAAVEHRRTNFAMVATRATWLTRDESSALVFGQLHLDLVSPR
jgi:hypothetical protein